MWVCGRRGILCWVWGLVWSGVAAAQARWLPRRWLRSKKRDDDADVDDDIANGQHTSSPNCNGSANEDTTHADLQASRVCSPRSHRHRGSSVTFKSGATMATVWEHMEEGVACPPSSVSSSSSSSSSHAWHARTLSQTMNVSSKDGGCAALADSDKQVASAGVAAGPIAARWNNGLRDSRVLEGWNIHHSSSSGSSHSRATTMNANEVSVELVILFVLGLGLCLVVGAGLVALLDPHFSVSLSTLTTTTTTTADSMPRSSLSSASPYETYADAARSDDDDDDDDDDEDRVRAEDAHEDEQHEAAWLLETNSPSWLAAHYPTRMIAWSRLRAKASPPRGLLGEENPRADAVEIESVSRRDARLLRALGERRIASEPTSAYSFGIVVVQDAAEFTEAVETLSDIWYRSQEHGGFLPHLCAASLAQLARLCAADLHAAEARRPKLSDESPLPRSPSGRGPRPQRRLRSASGVPEVDEVCDEALLAQVVPLIPTRGPWTSPTVLSLAQTGPVVWWAEPPADFQANANAHDETH